MIASKLEAETISANEAITNSAISALKIDSEKLKSQHENSVKRLRAMQDGDTEVNFQYNFLQVLIILGNQTLRGRK